MTPGREMDVEREDFDFVSSHQKVGACAKMEVRPSFRLSADQRDTYLELSLSLSRERGML